MPKSSAWTSPPPETDTTVFNGATHETSGVTSAEVPSDQPAVARI